MPRRLIVMRHAKSSWKDTSQEDHERPLNKRGQRDSGVIAQKLAELDWVPQRILSSDSARTRETCELMLETWKSVGVTSPPEIDFTRSLYLAGIDELYEQLHRVVDADQTVLTLGHNPGWEDVLEWLTGKSKTLTTANAALLTCHAPTWVAALEESRMWKLEELLRPKELLDEK